MDPVTHGALGAAWAQPAARESSFAPAALIGGASSLAPDLDFLIRSASDPLLAIEFHRHFTHALAFVPVGALLCAVVLYPLCGRRLGARAVYGFSLLGYASHGLLDTCTGYGTLLLWPFSDERIAWDLVSVVDPLVTIPLIALVMLGIVKRRARFAVIGIGWVLAYLCLGYIQSQRAAAVVDALAAARGHLPEAVGVKPTLGNVVLFRTLYVYGGRYYIDAVRVGLRSRVFEGVVRQTVDIERDFPWLSPDSQQWRDIERFRRFAEGYVALDPDAANRIIDLRYSLVPNRSDGFWGIELDPLASPDVHAAYVTMRARSTEEGMDLLRMLFPE